MSWGTLPALASAPTGHLSNALPFMDIVSWQEVPEIRATTIGHCTRQLLASYAETALLSTLWLS